MRRERSSLPRRLDLRSIGRLSLRYVPSMQYKLKFAPLSEPLSFWLDFVRGSAAVLVLLDHSRAQLFGSYDRSFAGSDHVLTKVFFVLFGMGTPAVMCFFVMSGLLIAPTLLSVKNLDGFFWIDFALQRMPRIWLSTSTS